jgi:hypothetical protein
MHIYLFSLKAVNLQENICIGQLFRFDRTDFEFQP